MKTCFLGRMHRSAVYRCRHRRRRRHPSSVRLLIVFFFFCVSEMLKRETFGRKGHPAPKWCTRIARSFSCILCGVWAYVSQCVSTVSWPFVVTDFVAAQGECRQFYFSGCFCGTHVSLMCRPAIYTFFFFLQIRRYTLRIVCTAPILMDSISCSCFRCFNSIGLNWR